MQIRERVDGWLDPPGVRAPTKEAFRSIWQQTARAESTRHPFHPEVLDDLDALLERVAAAPPETLVEVDGIPTRWDEVAEHYPRVWRRLTQERMRGIVLAEVRRAAEVADSADYLTARTRADQGHVLTVQHRRSGLRIQLSWSDGAGIGTVLAKSYSILSLDPRRRSPEEGSDAVDRWEGLGITSGLYRYGAALEPDLRWGVGGLTEQSAALRRRLHREDPWRFAAAKNVEEHPLTTCRWCLANGWADLDQEALGRHP